MDNTGALPPAAHVPLAPAPEEVSDEQIVEAITSSEAGAKAFIDLAEQRAFFSA